MSKSGFSTLNRWLGRKNKDKSMSNGKLSKSSTNLSVSSTNINETSQLEYNRITPLPAATTNAPFEQTFRITVLLPKDQLYVTRLGARIPLSKLLELVCDNKLLDAEKYEFRNPVDSSQVYSCDLTIGAVGLSEIRLCHKTDSYDNFNADEIIKLHRTSQNRESLSSSEFSSRYSKHTMKTTSPYSSSNSLNSMDSSGLNYSRIPVGVTPKLPPTIQPKMAAPPRKKRTAPRPPSQIAIPEKSALIVENGGQDDRNRRAMESPLATKDFSVSTPNLTSSTMLHSDINGNDCNGHHIDEYNGSSGNGSINSNGYNDDTVLYAQIQKKNALNLQDASLTEDGNSYPEPSPRKKIVPVIKKKTTAPPAPPPRNSMYLEDTQSLASTDATSMRNTPKGLHNPLEDFKPQQEELPKPTERVEHIKENDHVDLPKPQPRITTTTLLNVTDIENDLKDFESDLDKSNLKANVNVSKVLLNRTPTPEPRSLSCEPSDVDVSYDSHMQHFQRETTEDDCVSKQADSGIGEPIPSPIPDSRPCEISTLDVKTNFESSSDDDDMVKVYNFKLGKTLLKPLNETKTLEELTLMNSAHDEIDSDLGTPLCLTQTATPNTLSETSSWNFGIPISPPPNFADHKFMENLETESKTDAPITPKIMERPVLNFESFKPEKQQREKQEKPVLTPSQPPVLNFESFKPEEQQRVKEEKPVLTPSQPPDNLVDELSTIIQEKGIESLIKKAEDPAKIEAAKPNTLTNFTINSISQNNVAKPKEVFQESKESSEAVTSNTSSSIESKVLVKASKETKSSALTSPVNSPSFTPDEEKLYRKRNNVTSLKQRRSVTRSDSFHSTAIASDSVGLTKRTSSQLSLDQINGNLNRRRSSSELSIGDTPSLQSLEIIKTILKSRKNSLANSSSDDEKTKEVQARRPSDEVKFASLELKTTKFTERANKDKEVRNMEKELNAQEQYHQQIETDKKELMEEIKKVSREEFREEKPKELPKLYRYSGPPSINFSTWNERPKVQIQAIKNEGDYIFGGKNHSDSNKTVPRSYRMSTPAYINEQQYEERNTALPVAVKPAIIQRMGIPEKEYKVSVSVKPLKDVIIDNIVEQQPEIKEDKKEIINLTTAPSTPLAAQLMNGGLKTSSSARPTVETVLRPQTQFIKNNSTLPRSNKQRFSAPAARPGPQLLRSSSIKQEDKTQNCTSSVNEPTPAPFGQNTLRRTGFKEKILAKEEQEKQKAINTAAKLQPKQTSPSSNGDFRLSNQTYDSATQNSITSAKLHLNLKKSPTINPATKTPSPITPTYLLNPALKPKPETPKTTSINSSPPPPPMMAKQLRPVSVVRTPTTPTEEPRDQLLAAIRNFKVDHLKKA